MGDNGATLKVCFVQVHAYSMFNPQSKANIGGTELQLYLLSRELAKDERFDVSIIVGDWGQKDIEIYDGVKVYRSFPLQKEVAAYIRTPFLLWQTLKKVNADIYIPSAAGPEHGIVAFFCRRKKKKMIYRVAHVADVNKKFMELIWWQRVPYEYALKKTDSIICQSKEQNDWLKEYYQRTGIVVKNISPAVGSGRNFMRDRKFILWIGHAVLFKQPDFFIRLAKEFPNEQFVMVLTPDMQDLWDVIKKESEKMDNFKLVGKIPYNETQHYFEAAKIFVNTSTQEGFPNTFLQSAANGVPIVSLNSNPDNFLESHQCGFCAEGDFQRMKAQMGRLLSDSNLWQKMSSNALDYIKKNHSTDVIVNQWKQILFNNCEEKYT